MARRAPLRDSIIRCALRLLVLFLLATAAGCTAPRVSPEAAPETVEPAAPARPTALPATATAVASSTVPVPAGNTSPTPTSEKPMTTPTEATPDPLFDTPQVAQARADLADRLDVPPAEIEVVEVRAVTWPDGSLGCPQPGMAYTQVQQDGLLIRLQAGGQVYNYHSGGSRPPFLCEQQPGGEKTTPLSLEDFMTRADPDLDE